MMDWSVSLVVQYKVTYPVAGCRALQDGYESRTNLAASLMRLGDWNLRSCRFIAPAIEEAMRRDLFEQWLSWGCSLLTSRARSRRAGALLHRPLGLHVGQGLA